jgi:hypothetical protein
MTLINPATADALKRAACDLPGGAEAIPGLTGLRTDWTWREVARYTPGHEDGGEAVVYVVRAPAMFWRLACPDKNITCSTGSDMHGLVHDMAAAIAGGMLGGDDDPQKEETG